MQPGASSKRYQLIAAGLLVASLVLVNANVEAGMNDDWSYVATARALAATGRLQYNGWAAPLIGFQAYWAALFIRLIGFSFLTTRGSAWLLALLAIPVLWQLFRSVEDRPAVACAGTLFFLLSPLVLPNLATFMTDMPAFFLFAASLLCALKAWGASSERKAMFWLAGCTLCGIASGSVRQLYLPAPICFLLVLAVAKIRSFHGRLMVVFWLALTLAFGFWASRWMNQQPFVPSDRSLQELRHAAWPYLLQTAGLDLARGFLGLSVVSLPFTILLAGFHRTRTLLVAAGIVAVSFLLPAPGDLDLPWLGNTVTNFGVIRSGTIALGDKPVILFPHLLLALATTGIVAAVLAATVPLLRLRIRNAGVRRFATLTLPFLVIYTAIVDLRAPSFGLYDRYFIPHLFVVDVLALGCIAQKRIGRMVSAGVLFTLYALATTHDYFSEARARLAAANQVLKAGNIRTDILGGFEFDCWTQLEKTGHINNELLTKPPGAYQNAEDCSGPDDTQLWWRTLAPAIHARYVVTLSHLAGLAPSGFPGVEFSRWLPLGRYTVYVEQVSPKDDLLTCKSSDQSKP